MTDHATDSRESITIERIYRARVEVVWELWTTKDGIESWWGPEGFQVVVQQIDLRPGGQLRYAMTAIAPEQAEYMTKAGMPLTTELSITYTHVETLSRLGYINHVDFVPDHGPYDVGTLVELLPDGDLVRMVLTIDAMHSDEWTRRATMGWESELGKLEQVLAQRPGRPPRLRLMGLRGRADTPSERPASGWAQS
jgi:uncharacterized protein YndB with AHSA1/START domain